jgi:hypothetical protein
LINKILTLIREWSGYYELSEELNSRIIDLSVRHDVLYQELEVLKESYLEVQEKYDLSKEQISELLKKETIDILELKGWYEGRRNQNSWFYNGRRLGNADVRRYLIPSDIKPFTDLANELISRYKLSEDNSPTEVITAMYKYWNLKSSWNLTRATRVVGRPHRSTNQETGGL